MFQQAPPHSGLPPEGEQAWKALCRHLDRSARFTLVFLISEDPSALDEVRGRLEIELQLRAARLVIIEPAGPPVHWVDPLESALAPEHALIQARSPVWLALAHHPDDPLMGLQRDTVLAALNQYRSSLEHAFQRPLLIALPQAYLPRICAVAPDLWTIRGSVAAFPSRL